MLKKIELLILIVLITGCFSTCKFDLLTSTEFPDNTEGSGNIATKATWDPYIGVHPFGCDAGIQQPYLLKLIRAGALRGIRLGNLQNPEVQRFAAWFQNQGVEILGLFDNEYLRNPNICQIFSQHVAQNPGITVWEIGNEVRGFPECGFVGFTPEEYMQIAMPLFYYVKQNHPNVRLAIGAVAGNGSSADDLRRMIDAGLNKLCQDGLEIVPIHFYSWKSMRLAEFQSQIARLPISTRIWITETNDMPPSWNTQIGYVTEMYPKLKSALRAERIYWYVFSEPSDFALVKGLADNRPVEYSPLMKLLIEEPDSNSAMPTTVLSPEFKPIHNTTNNKKKTEKNNQNRKSRRQK